MHQRAVEDHNTVGAVWDAHIAGVAFAEQGFQIDLARDVGEIACKRACRTLMMPQRQSHTWLWGIIWKSSNVQCDGGCALYTTNPPVSGSRLASSGVTQKLMLTGVTTTPRRVTVCIHA